MSSLIAKISLRLRSFLSCCLLLCFCAAAICRAEDTTPAVRVSAWYWLNSAPKADWAGDFVTMKNLGFTDILICWGLDVAGISTRKSDTKEAIRAAHKAGLGVYLIVWQPQAHSLKWNPKYMQIDANGKQLPCFDVFNPEWRSTQWKSYLQDIAKAYGNEPGMAGYAFDDSFTAANVSYGAFEEKAFGAPLPRSTKDARWEEWTKVRQGWWEDWAKDTVSYIREIDSNPRHEIYLEDLINHIVNKAAAVNSGLDFVRVAKHFDAVGGYTMPGWTTNADSQSKVLTLSSNAIESVRRSIGPDKKLIYTFWSANAPEERLRGPALHPTAAEIQGICELALKLGVRHLDMYGYRIGDYQTTREDLARMVPAEPAPYVLTGQFPQKFMWDRPEIHTDLGKYLRSLNQPKHSENGE